LPSVNLLQTLVTKVKLMLNIKSTIMPTYILGNPPHSPDR